MFMFSRSCNYFFKFYGPYLNRRVVFCLATKISTVAIFCFKKGRQLKFDVMTENLFLSSYPYFMKKTLFTGQSTQVTVYSTKSEVSCPLLQDCISTYNLLSLSSFYKLMSSSLSVSWLQILSPSTKQLVVDYGKHQELSVSTAIVYYYP